MKSPPFCPNPCCSCHYRKSLPCRWFTKSGWYKTLISGRVQRYRCTVCGRRFSSQTFSIDYYTKKHVNYSTLLRYLRTTSSSRDMARELKVSLTTVDNRIDRLCRSMIAAHLRILTSHRLQEALVADGFESFISSQYFPNNIHLLVGKESQYVYGLNYVPLRRKGRMTEAQKKRREVLEKRYTPPPRAVEDSFAHLFLDFSSLIQESRRKPVYLYTDEKKEYPRALRSVPAGKQILQIRLSSHVPRNLTNPLFSVNYIDREIRKDQANYVRETVCFARNVNHALSRLVVYLMSHNYLKVFREREKRKDHRSHAEVAGLPQNRIAGEFRFVFTRRAFFQRSGITGFFRDLWLKRFQTPLKASLDSLPLYAFA